LATHRSIRVRDANGDHLTVFEHWEPCLFGWATEQRFELCTGEEVGQLCDNAFVVARTGELLTCGISSGGIAEPARERRSALSLSGADRLSNAIAIPLVRCDTPARSIPCPWPEAERERHLSDPE